MVLEYVNCVCVCERESHPDQSSSNQRFDVVATCSVYTHPTTVDWKHVNIKKRNVLKSEANYNANSTKMQYLKMVLNNNNERGWTHTRMNRIIELAHFTHTNGAHNFEQFTNSVPKWTRSSLGLFDSTSKMVQKYFTLNVSMFFFVVDLALLKQLQEQCHFHKHV